MIQCIEHKLKGTKDNQRLVNSMGISILTTKLTSLHSVIPHVGRTQDLRFQISDSRLRIQKIFSMFFSHNNFQNDSSK